MSDAARVEGGEDMDKRTFCLDLLVFDEPEGELGELLTVYCADTYEEDEEEDDYDDGDGDE